MKLRPLSILPLALLLACAVAPAFAQDDGVDDTVPEILTTQHALRAKLDQPSGEYSRFNADDVALMRMQQDKVFRMLDGVSSLDELNAQKKTELSNALDAIKATLAHNAGNRLVCYRERKTGTNLVEKRCETMDQRESRARDSQQQMREYERTPQLKHG